MKNSLKSFVLVLAFILLVSCTPQEGEPQSQTDHTPSKTTITTETMSYIVSENNNVEDKTVKSIVTIDNTTPLSKLLTDSYTLEEINNDIFFYVYSSDQRSYIKTYSEIKETMRTNFMRKTSEDSYYTVYKISEDGLLYLFYTPFGHDDFAYNGAVYITRENSLNDFSKIKKGTKIGTVEEIEPAITSLMKMETDDSTGFFVVIVAKDGVVALVFEKKNGEFYVNLKEVSSDFNLDYSKLHGNRIINYEILQQDYPEMR